MLLRAAGGSLLRAATNIRPGPFQRPFDLLTALSKVEGHQIFASRPGAAP
jgi:hypothetical protein